METSDTGMNTYNSCSASSVLLKATKDIATIAITATETALTWVKVRQLINRIRVYLFTESTFSLVCWCG